MHRFFKKEEKKISLIGRYYGPLKRESMFNYIENCKIIEISNKAHFRATLLGH
jgi:hypothetical protein